ncbi:unnamed protein product [Allacma fusca]|uniref:C2H2-type domain-containing protein n=1 Tax=Allacma fusca TaxID=39272 RepID=A0A8J2NGW4_9HEXA|nr:unnamed protein product [Allacma fusca]
MFVIFFECPVCLKTFARNATRKLHMELHNLEKAFMCELCGRSYSSQIHLNRHIASHKRDRKRKRKTIIKKEESEAVPQEVEIEATNIVEDFLEL